MSYLDSQFQKQVTSLSAPLQEKLTQDHRQLTQIGITSPQDHQNFIVIWREAPRLGRSILGRKLTVAEVSQLAQKLYQERTKYSVENLGQLYSVGAQIIFALDWSGFRLKVSYPVSSEGMSVEQPHNLQKWAATLQAYYALLQQGYPNQWSLAAVTQGWDIMERQDFEGWMSFYQEQGHTKYKTAQFSPEPKYYQAGEGTMIPLDHLKARIPGMPDFSGYPEMGSNMLAEQQHALKRQEAEQAIKAIVGRLNAAERLITRPEVQSILTQMLKEGLPSWLEALHRLKREIQTAPLRALRAFENLKIKDIHPMATDLLVQDLLFKEANILQAQGKIFAARLMLKIAQVSGPPTPMPNPEGPPQDDNGEEALNELVKGMNNEDITDSHEVEDGIVEEEPLTATAQVVAPSEDLSVAPIETAPETDPSATLEETSNIAVEPNSEAEVMNSGIQDPPASDPFEAALSQVSINDVVNRLQAVANIFRNREIARQLAIIDLMMDKLGIASFFPSMAEASSKSLESNQYALTRIEDILSKILGSVETPAQHQVELSGPPTSVPAQVSPEANPAQLQQNLVQDQAKEVAKKERRQEMEDVKNSGPAVTPLVTNAPEELAQPMTLQAPSVPLPKA